MSSSYQDRALALAGVAQFTQYAHGLGSDGRDLPERRAVAQHAIFCTDPDSVSSVYGGLSAVGDGIAYLKAQLYGRKKDAQSALVARYMGQILRLSRRLMHDESARNQLRGVIDRARLAESHNVEDILAEGYQNTISPLKPRIMLRGHETYLKNPVIQARVRVQLMAAIRCGYMWRQCGGNIPALFYRRKALVSALNQIGPARSQ